MSSNSYSDDEQDGRHIEFVSGLAKRIKEARIARGVSQEALAKVCGISRSAVSQWETGGKTGDGPSAPTLDKLESICDLLEVNSEWLITSRGPRDKKGQDENDTIAVDEYDVRVSAGGGFLIDEETVRGVWLFSRQYLTQELRLDASHLVVLEVIGDSMEPTLRSGDRVLVDMGDKRVSQPGVFVLWDGDGTVVKRLEKIPSSNPMKLRTISDNPHHNPYEVLASDTVIVGRVVWYARRT